jgi:hypothetical protein
MGTLNFLLVEQFFVYGEMEKQYKIVVNGLAGLQVKRLGKDVMQAVKR